MEAGAPTRELFGGAIRAAIPARLMDVSDFRPVPDNQEVFAVGGTDQSLIVEVVEAVPREDAGLAAYLLQDYAAANEATGVTVLSTRLLGADEAPGLPPDQVAVLAEGSMKAAKGTGQGGAQVNRVHVLLAAVRVPAHRAELLLVLNTPAGGDAEGAAGEQAAHSKAAALLAGVLKSLVIADYGLFG